MALANFPTLIFEVGFNTDPTTELYLHFDDVARGKWDTNTFAPDLTFTDISSKVHGFSTTRPSNRVAGPVLRFEAGSLSADLNNTDRALDPTSNPDVSPNRVVRVRATWAGMTYNIWRGGADSWLPGYIKGDSYASVTLDATDGFKDLGNNIRAAVAAVGTGELSGARIDRVLTSAGWPTADRIIDTGQTTLQSTILDGDALSELQLVSDSEIGSLYMDGAGHVVFRDRHANFNETRSNMSNGIFGDNLSTELPYYGIAPSFDDEQLINQALITRNGGTQQVSTDAASVSKNKIHGYEQSGLLMQTDTTASDYAKFIVYMSKDSEYRFDSLTINPLADPANLFPHVLGREIGDRITVRRRPPGGGSMIERDVLIVGINHDVDCRVGTWMTSWQLQSVAKQSFMVFDHATLGKWDSNAFAY